MFTVLIAASPGGMLANTSCPGSSLMKARITDASRTHSPTLSLGTAFLKKLVYERAPFRVVASDQLLYLAQFLPTPGGHALVHAR
jgi:hypothetical protein